MKQSISKFKVFLKNVKSEMTILKISFSNFLAQCDFLLIFFVQRLLSFNYLMQRLILWRSYGYPVLFFPKSAVYSKPDSKVHLMQGFPFNFVFPLFKDSASLIFQRASWPQGHKQWKTGWKSDMIPEPKLPQNRL